MSDMTAEERAERSLPIGSAVETLGSDWGEIATHYRIAITDQIRQAEAAARRKALEEAAACAGWVADMEGSWKKNLSNRELHILKAHWVGRTEGGKEVLQAIQKLMDNPDD